MNIFKRLMLVMSCFSLFSLSSCKTNDSSETKSFPNFGQCYGKNQDGKTCGEMNIPDSGEETCSNDATWTCEWGCAKWLRDGCEGTPSEQSNAIDEDNSDSNKDGKCFAHNRDGKSCKQMGIDFDASGTCVENAVFSCVDGCAQWIRNGCEEVDEDEEKSTEPASCEGVNEDAKTCEEMGLEFDSPGTCSGDNTWACVDGCAKWIKSGCDDVEPAEETSGGNTDANANASREKCLPHNEDGKTCRQMGIKFNSDGKCIDGQKWGCTSNGCAEFLNQEC